MADGKGQRGLGCGIIFVLFAVGSVMRACDPKSAVTVNDGGNDGMAVPAPAASAVKPGYPDALKVFVAKVNALPGVTRAEVFDEDGMKVYLPTNPTHGQARQAANELYQDFYAVRLRYMPADRAEVCNVFLYDADGDEVYNATYYTQ